MKHSIAFLKMTVLFTAIFILSGCYEPLMPTPMILTVDELEAYEKLPEEQKTNTVDVFYATNRKGSGPLEDRKYGNGVDPCLHLGISKVRFGPKKMIWDDLYFASIRQKREKKIIMYLDNSTEYGLLSTTLDPDLPEKKKPKVPVGDQAFIDAINEKLSRTPYKVIKIYVHGFKVSFYNPVVVGGQLHHFSSRQGVTITFAWPSHQNELRYLGDVKRAENSIPELTALLDLLAKTDAEKISILSYSAGAPIASGALVQLREKYKDLNEQALQDKLKIDTVIFAASDVDFRTFVEQYKQFYDIPRKIAITVSQNDFAMNISKTIHGASRLGSLDLRELVAEELDEIREHYRDKLDILDISYTQKITNNKELTGHGYWYKNSWISTDIIASIYLDLNPEERGLLRSEEDRNLWYFPEDYPDRVRENVRQSVAQQEQTGQP